MDFKKYDSSTDLFFTVLEAKHKDTVHLNPVQYKSSLCSQYENETIKNFASM